MAGVGVSVYVLIFLHNAAIIGLKVSLEEPEIGAVQAGQSLLLYECKVGSSDEPLLLMRCG